MKDIYIFKNGETIPAKIEKLFETHGPYTIEGKRLDLLSKVQVVVDSSKRESIINSEILNTELTAELTFEDQSSLYVLIKSIESFHWLLGFSNQQPLTDAELEVEKNKALNSKFERQLNEAHEKAILAVGYPKYGNKQAVKKAEAEILETTFKILQDTPDVARVVDYGEFVSIYQNTINKNNTITENTVIDEPDKYSIYWLLSLIFGILLLILGVAERSWPAFFSALLLLPPVRSFVYLITKIKLSANARGLAILVILIIGPSLEQNQEDATIVKESEPTQTLTTQADEATPAPAMSLSPPKSVAATSTHCPEGSVYTGAQFYVIGTGHELRDGPGKNYKKIVNEKATSMSTKTQYVSIDDSTTVYEECTNEGWSWVRVIKPDWLQESHRGWVETKYIDKATSSENGNKYAGKIPTYVLTPYTSKEYPKTVAKFKPRLKEIESLRKKAAMMAVDSGKCDRVTASEIDSDSSLKNLRFYVDCEGFSRIYLTENEILKGSPVKTQKEKAWTPENALASCKQGIKDRALIPSEVEIHDIIGSTFSEAPITHNVVVTMDFEAKNAVNAKIPYTATCHFEPGMLGTINVSIRK